MRLIIAFLTAVSLMLYAGCKASEDPEAGGQDNRPSRVPNAAEASKGLPSEDVISDTGTIRYIDLEGGFYGIETDSARYNPLNLDDAFKEDGLTVHFRALKRTDVMTIQMWGTPVEILEMMRVETVE